MVGAVPGAEMVRANGAVTLLAAFVAVTLMVETPAVGVPVNNPPLDKLAQPGKPVALNVIGELPEARNWKEYAIAAVPPGSGLVLRNAGAVTAIMRVNVRVTLPTGLVAVTLKLNVPSPGPPVSNPVGDRLMPAGIPEPVNVMTGEPEARNRNE